MSFLVDISDTSSIVNINFKPNVSFATTSWVAVITLQNHVQTWAVVNITNKFKFKYVHIRELYIDFENEEDAVLFKLTWL
jgi:hypothetical protein